jgi:hypothetical protein
MKRRRGRDIEQKSANLEDSDRDGQPMIAILDVLESKCQGMRILWVRKEW